MRGTYYDSHAFARDEEAAAVLCRLLKPLEALPCDLTFDDARLDEPRPVEAEEAMIAAKKVKAEAEVCVYIRMRLRDPLCPPCSTRVRAISPEGFVHGSASPFRAGYSTCF